MNRALQGQYPPASIFKIIVAAAGLQEGSLTPMDRVFCNGEFTLRNWTFKDWKPGGHGHVNLHAAIAQSCDIFFYHAGIKVGPDIMSKYAQAFGFGAPTGIDLGGERFGLVPLSPAQRQRTKRSWLPGDTVNMSIGQGRLLVTPLQVARMMGAVANGGVLWKPRLVQRVERPDGTLAYASTSQMTERVELSPVVWAFLRHSLAAVVKDGTGALARVPGIEIAGKTGTAQTISKSDASKGQDHAWFASFAPVDDPRYVVVVLVERGGKGGQVAAPIAQQIYEAIFLQKVAQVTLGESG
jgi:penicillin-binding protein 2